MDLSSAILAGGIVVAILLALVLTKNPRLTASAGGRVLAFLALCALPALLTAGGTKAHFERSKTTQFCLSCHPMESYGDSLHLDDPTYLPAAHYQNRQVPRDRACYTCHTNYAMFGDVKAKIAGLRHLWVYYAGEVPDKLELYEPYDNRVCFHCHEGARSFLERREHEEVMAEIESGEISCMECHENVHPADGMEEMKRWPGEAK